MLRLPQRSVLLRAAAVTLALLTARLVATDLASLHARARSAGHEVPVLVALDDLALGHTVRTADLTTVLRYSAHLPPRALGAPSDATARVVVSPVLRGEVVTDRHLAPRNRTGLDGVVPPGMRAVRVVPSDGMRPPGGATVDVLVSFDQALVGPDVDATMTVVRGALVLAVDGPDVEMGEGGEVAVTLLVDVDAAHRLAYAAANGIVTLALAPPEDSCCTPSSSASSRG